VSPPPEIRLLKGRGALSNPDGRFESLRVQSVEDGWYQEALPESVATAVKPERAKSIITTNDSPDVGFESSINPYRGCEHGCVYCYARPAHSYVGLSPGLDFETKLFYKADAAQLLEQELARPGYVCKPIAIGMNTDAYQPVEKQLGVTRSILTVLARCRHPASLITKSTLILRDLDLLADMARDDLCAVAVSLTSLSAETKRTLEPRTASPQARLRVIQELTAAGIPVSVMVAPVIPAITDHELEHLLEAAHAAGACAAGYVLLRLPHEVKTLFREWLNEHYPDRAQHVMSLVNDLRGGRDNDPRFGTRMRGTGPFAELLSKRFEVAYRRLGFHGRRERELTTAHFRRPVPVGGQLGLEL
jgi:DNA repair photolyase